MMVMMIATTPSVNASTLPLPMITTSVRDELPKDSKSLTDVGMPINGVRKIPQLYQGKLPVLCSKRTKR